MEKPRSGGSDTPADYEEASAAVWASLDEGTPAAFLERIERLVRSLPPGSPVASFERACAFDSTGHPEQAVPLYREALELGISGERRRRSVIQLASSLRNLGQLGEALELLQNERRTSDDLDDAVTAVLALVLTDSGREREAVSIAVEALAKHLPRYQRSMASYARALREEIDER